jgi:hypothetical protein
MRFHAQRVSASAAGDYFQLSLGPEESDEKESDPYEVTGPYLLVQRQFEMPDRGRCYLETHDEGYIDVPDRTHRVERSVFAFRPPEEV